MRRLFFSGILLAILVSLTLSGCGPELEDDIETALTLPGDDWGFPSPFAFYPRGPGYIRMSLLFDTLTWKDEEGVIDWLAEEWSSSEDAKEWTFTLRSDLTWHDGQPLTAKDVAFTYRYFTTHRAGIQWSWPLDKIADAVADGERRVTITLNEPIADPHAMLFGSLPVIPEHIWKGVDEPVRFTGDVAVVGSGPFTLVEYNKEEGRYRYGANADYFNGRPLVDRLTFIKVENEALALETGGVDAARFWGKEIEAVRALQETGEYASIEGPSFWVLQMIFNTQKEPFHQVEVRQAIAHAVNRVRIVDQVTHGGAIVANLGILSPFTEWANPDLPSYPHEPERARDLLAEAGVSDLELELLTTGDYAREAELIEEDLEAVGIEVQVRTGDRTTVDGLLREGGFDLAINGHGGIANPAMLETPTWPAGVYQNEIYDQLYAEQAQTLDPERRLELVWELQSIVAEELPVLTLWHPKMWTVYNPEKLDTWFYTDGGIGFGIPLPMNKLVFLER